ncbi:MAG: F0F1 ATP synthase subunit B [Oscillospiraceae bacterium]
MLNIDLWDILWTVINLLLFFILLKKFLFGPVTAMMDRRAQMIKDEIDSAKAANDEAKSLKAKYEEELKDAHQQSVKITANAQKRAEQEYKEIVESARADAANMIAAAEKTIKREQAQAVDAAKDQIAGLAVMAASQVLAKNIDEESNRAYAEQLLAEVGAVNE